MDFLFDTLPDGVTIVRGALDQNAQQDFVKTCREIISGHFGWRTTDKPTTLTYSAQNKTAKLPAAFTELVTNCARSQSISCQAISKAEISFFPLEAGKIPMARGNAGTSQLILSLGATAEFLIGSEYLAARPEEISVETGDVLIFDERSAPRFRGVDKLSGESSGLLKNGGRIAVTFEFN